MKLEVEFFDPKLGRKLADDFFRQQILKKYFVVTFCDRRRIAKSEVKNFDLKLDGGLYGRR